MVRRVFIILVALALAVSLTAMAAEGTATGRYSIHNTSVDTAQTPGGGLVQVAHYKQSTFASEAGHPIDNTSADCVGVTRVDAAGKVTSASGSCYTTDGDGDGTSFWWRMEDAASDSCPALCGSWGYFDGYGKFKGITGGGKWVQTTLFPDGSSSGTWKGSYSMP